MPLSKKPRIKTPRAEKAADPPLRELPEELTTQREGIPGYQMETLKESTKENTENSGKDTLSGVGLKKQGEHAVPETETHTHTIADSAPDTGAHAAAAAAAEAAIKRLKADVVITRHVAVAAGAGLIPLPVVDFAAVSTVQITMLALICGIYNQPFSKEAATSIIASLAGGAITGNQAGSLTLASRLKFVPVIGTLLGFFVTPAVAGATTYAIGKVFVHHLETGGTVFTFEAKKLKEYMEKSLQEGKKLVPHWGTQAAATPAPAAAH
jgi:uncharacterized protein (DUF697 family)